MMNRQYSIPQLKTLLKTVEDQIYQTLLSNQSNNKLLFNQSYQSVTLKTLKYIASYLNHLNDEQSIGKLIENIITLLKRSVKEYQEYTLADNRQYRSFSPSSNGDEFDKEKQNQIYYFMNTRKENIPPQCLGRLGNNLDKERSQLAQYLEKLESKKEKFSIMKNSKHSLILPKQSLQKLKIGRKATFDVQTMLQKQQEEQKFMNIMDNPNFDHQTNNQDVETQTQFSIVQQIHEIKTNQPKENQDSIHFNQTEKEQLLDEKIKFKNTTKKSIESKKSNSHRKKKQTKNESSSKKTIISQVNKKVVLKGDRTKQQANISIMDFISADVQAQTAHIKNKITQEPPNRLKIQSKQINLLISSNQQLNIAIHFQQKRLNSILEEVSNQSEKIFQKSDQVEPTKTQMTKINLNAGSEKGFDKTNTNNILSKQQIKNQNVIIENVQVQQLAEKIKQKNKSIIKEKNEASLPISTVKINNKKKNVYNKNKIKTKEIKQQNTTLTAKPVSSVNQIQLQEQKPPNILSVDHDQRQISAQNKLISRNEKVDIVMQKVQPISGGYNQCHSEHISPKNLQNNGQTSKIYLSEIQPRKNQFGARMSNANNLIYRKSRQMFKTNSFSTFLNNQYQQDKEKYYHHHSKLIQFNSSILKLKDIKSQKSGSNSNFEVDEMKSEDGIFKNEKITGTMKNKSKKQSFQSLLSQKLNQNLIHQISQYSSPEGKDNSWIAEDNMKPSLLKKKLDSFVNLSSASSSILLKGSSLPKTKINENIRQIKRQQQKSSLSLQDMNKKKEELIKFYMMKSNKHKLDQYYNLIKLSHERFCGLNCHHITQLYDGFAVTSKDNKFQQKIIDQLLRLLKLPPK